MNAFETGLNLRSTRAMSPSPPGFPSPDFSDTGAAHRLVSKLPDVGGASAPTSAGENPEPTPFGSHQCRLVVVDDDARFRESLCALLESKGYSPPMACASGEELFECVDHPAQGAVDLILLDLCLGDESGLDLLRRLRDGRYDVAVIVLSGDSAIKSAVDAMQFGASDFVCKPYDPQALIRTVDTVLGRRAAERAGREAARRLAYSEQVHRFLVDSSPDLIFALDEKHDFAIVSDQVAELVGESVEKLVGTSFLSIVFPDDQDKAAYALERICNEPLTTELRLVSREDRAPQQFEIKLTPVDFLPGDPCWNDHCRCNVYGVARDISERMQATERLAHLAHHDALTGLPNRVLFQDRLGLAMTQARRSGMRLATLFVDLDRFKQVNDAFGHQRGDELLKEVARRLSRGLRETDTLARLGGDEFTVLLPALRTRDDAANVASKLVAEMAQPFQIAGAPVSVTASIGISMYPEDGEGVEALLRHADMSMYHVKTHGKNGFVFFSRDLGEPGTRHLSTGGEIRQGLGNGQFELFYQPQVDAATLAIVGAEAFVRWQHPVRGLLTAGNFIHAVEEAGLMCELTGWIIETAGRDLQRIRASGCFLPRVSVNIPPGVLMTDTFHARLIECLSRYGIPHRSLELEITESLFLGDHKPVVERLLQLTSDGFSIAIEDFGTRYSSLGYLREVPIGTIKIDQSFVQEIERLDDRSPATRAIVAMAISLGVNVIAEGVETVVQAEFLRGLGCPQMQGYLYGHPVSPAELERLLQIGRPANSPG